MTDNAPSGVKVDSPKRTIKADDYRDVYCNTTKTAITQWDVRLIAALAVDLDDSPVIKELVTIIMSPQHAKAVMKNMAETIQKYEALFGPIPDPIAFQKGRKMDTQASGADSEGKKK